MPRKPSTSYDFSNYPLGCIQPPSKKHLLAYPVRALDVNPLQRPQRPKYVMHPGGIRYDQGEEGACVGFAITAWCSAWVYNHLKHVWRYNAREVYLQAQRIDEVPGENYEGTTVVAGLEIVRTQGNARLRYPSQRLWINEYRWATQVSDILDHVAFVGPVVIGTDWHENFDHPERDKLAKKTAYFIGRGDLGPVRGGHAIMLNGYFRRDDGTEFVRFQNSWGFRYPLVWMPVTTLQTLWDRRVLEAAMITSAPRLSPECH